MVIKREVAEKHLWAILNIFKAFEDATNYVEQQRMAMVVNHLETGLLPLKIEAALRTPLVQQGVIANREELRGDHAVFIRTGLTPRKLELSEVFSPNTLDK